MKISKSFVLASALLAAGVLVACSDDDNNNVNDDRGASGGSDGEGTGGGDGSGGDGSGGTTAGGYPELPGVLAVQGCEELNLGPICTVSQNDGTFTANCGGLVYEGTVGKDDETVTFGYEGTNNAGEAYELSCEGEIRLGAIRNAQCRQVLQPHDEEVGMGGAGPIIETPDPVETVCSFSTKTSTQPGLNCMNLPDKISGLELTGGAAPIPVGECSIVQDECNFQAACPGDVVFAGSATETGLSFGYPLVALADANTNPNNGSVAFLQGEVVNHSCSIELTDSVVGGECGAGGVGRGGSHSSIYTVGGSFTAPASCDLIAPTAGHIFALDSCELMKEGEGANPGIGEPVCIIRQNDCVFEIQCGKQHVFNGVLEPGASKFEFNLTTGTPCEVSVDGSGNVTGKCTVPGEESCFLKSMPAVPADESECPTLPVDSAQSLWSQGCGDAGNSRLSCNKMIQHGCNWVGDCSFRGVGSYAPSGVISYADQAETLSKITFNGVNGWTCTAQEATAEDVSSDYRFANEWYGDCYPASGEGTGACRNTFDSKNNDDDPESVGGPLDFRGLRLFWSQENDLWDARNAP